MASEYRYFITCPQCGTESPEPAFGRRAECVCPCCNETKIEPRSDGHGFDRYFDRISLTTGRGNRFEISACEVCIASGLAIATLRTLARQETER